MQSTDFEWLWHCQWKFVNCNTCTTLWGCWQWGKLCICWGSECRKSLPSSQFCREPKTPLKNSLHKNQYTLLNKGNKEIKLVRDHQKVQSVKERLELYWDFLPDEIRMERTLEKFRFGEKQQLFGHKYSSWGNLWILNFPQLPTHTPIPPKVRILLEIHLQRVSHKTALTARADWRISLQAVREKVSQGVIRGTRVGKQKGVEKEKGNKKDHTDDVPPWKYKYHMNVLASIHLLPPKQWWHRQLWQCPYSSAHFISSTVLRNIDMSRGARGQ